MSTLRQQLIQELVLRGCSPRTQEAYVSAVYQPAKYYRRSPDQVSDPEIKDYLFHLAVAKKLSASSRNQATSALRFFYAHVLLRPVDHLARVLPRPRQRRFTVHGSSPSRSWSACSPSDASTRGIAPS